MNPESVYCATWTRVRRLTYRRAFGVDCAVWRSADGGGSWTKIVNGLPPAGDNLGRIAIAVAPSRPSRLYASVISGAAGGYVGLGLYRSDDGGQSWLRADVGTAHQNAFGGFGWYFGMLEVTPNNADEVWVGGVSLLRSADAGGTLVNETGLAHVDQHALWIDPTNTARAFLGNDGGLFSRPSGFWQKSSNLPITQFYAGTVDAQNASKILGGAQDNGTNRTETGPLGWAQTLGGDGMHVLVNPTNTNDILAEWQNCCDKSGFRRSTNNGASYNSTVGWLSSDRFNWNTPIARSPRNPNTLLSGSHRAYKSTNGGTNWVPVSGDLTNGPGAAVVYNTITTVAISAADSNLYLAGTDDGRVWRSQNAGSSWEEISAGLPARYVTRVVADPNDAQVLYVAHSGFGQDLHDPRVFLSANRGDTWTPIAGNLPDAPVNDLVVDPDLPGSLYAFRSRSPPPGRSPPQPRLHRSSSGSWARLNPRSSHACGGKPLQPLRAAPACKRTPGARAACNRWFWRIRRARLPG